jgi:hypothetical protein
MNVVELQLIRMVETDILMVAVAAGLAVGIVILMVAVAGDAGGGDGNLNGCCFR